MSEILDRLPSYAATLKQRLGAFMVAQNARSLHSTSKRDASWRALAGFLRDELQLRWQLTQKRDQQLIHAGQARRVHYLSMEFLLGRALNNAIAALDVEASVRESLQLGALSLSEVLEGERDAALGNGGLGRLAACFLDSFAELSMPAFGYGLRYEFGMFAQRIQDGRQIEEPDAWLKAGNPWEVARPEVQYVVAFGGRVLADGHGRRWEPAQRVLAQAFDFIVPAHHSEHVATLRQWRAVAAEPIDFAAFCRGDHMAAGAHRLEADALNWVLYPDDSNDAGRELRLRQEAFLVSASLQDLLARHLSEGGRIDQLGLRNAIHLNDTHPALAPAELLRLLLDEHGLEWDAAWRITRQACSYTNHTLLPEALETWPIAMFERLLPRHLEIIFQINQAFLQEVRSRFPGNEALVSGVSLIEEGEARRVRMAALAIVASHKVNGVAALHSKLMCETIFADFAKLYPQRFFNVTNGVTPRRWLQQANPGLSRLLDLRIGTQWRRDLTQLQALKAYADDPDLLSALHAVKRNNKHALTQKIRRELGIVVDSNSLFDVQIKRIHEYKRQLLNLLHVVARYQGIVQNPLAPNGKPWLPRTVVIAGKAASAYRTAKQIVRLAHDVARAINSDPRSAHLLKLVFLPNYGVSTAEVVIPATDLSEQISTAGTEASGTGNMKFALNGALTIGTWDGANIEMAQAIGESDVFIFGARVETLAALQSTGYDPRLYVEQDLRLQQVLAAISDGHFSPEEPNRYRELIEHLMLRDRYFLMADFASYLASQDRVDQLYAQPTAWGAAVIRNIAGMGEFSADRSVQQYLDQVWSPTALRRSGLGAQNHA